MTGQEMISLLIMASRLAALKSLHSTDEPVIATWMRSVPSSASGPLRSSAARTISLVSGVAAPAVMTAVRPSALIESAGLRRDDLGDARVGRSSAVACSTTCAAGGVVEGAGLGVHDDLQRGAGEAAELALDDVADGDGLRARGLPAGTGQGVLDLRGEGAQPETRDPPEDEDGAQVAGGPDPEAAERAERGPRRLRGQGAA